MMPTLVSVSDISSYLFCPRKVFYRLVHGKREPQNEGALKGNIVHNAIKHAIQDEAKLLQSIQKPQVADYQESFQNKLKATVSSNQEGLKAFGADDKKILFELTPMINMVAQKRFENISALTESGLKGDEILKCVEPKLISEMYMQSPALGLKGRIDCTELWKDKIVPVDFKTSNLFGSATKGDVLQVTGYIMLLKDNYGKAANVPYGTLRYVRDGREFIVERKEENVFEVNKITDAIRSMVATKQEPEKCKNAYCTICSA